MVLMAGGLEMSGDSKIKFIENFWNNGYIFLELSDLYRPLSFKIPPQFCLPFFGWPKFLCLIVLSRRSF